MHGASLRAVGIFIVKARQILSLFFQTAQTRLISTVILMLIQLTDNGLSWVAGDKQFAT